MSEVEIVITELERNTAPIFSWIDNNLMVTIGSPLFAVEKQPSNL